jgi:guanine nucleotide exchange factor
MKIPIHKPKKDESEPQILAKHWRVEGHINFENIGVTRAVSSEYKYLMCADCELGPLGIVFLNEPTMFYVADARVKYGN